MSGGERNAMGQVQGQIILSLGGLDNQRGCCGWMDGLKLATLKYKSIANQELLHLAGP